MQLPLQLQPLLQPLPLPSFSVQPLLAPPSWQLQWQPSLRQPFCPLSVFQLLPLLLFQKPLPLLRPSLQRPLPPPPLLLV